MVIHPPPGVISVSKMSQTPKMGQQLGHITVARCIGHGPGQQNKTIASLSHPILSLQPLPDTREGHSSTSRGHFCVKNEPRTQKEVKVLPHFSGKAHWMGVRPAKQGHHILVPSHTEPPTTSRHTGGSFIHLQGSFLCQK